MLAESEFIDQLSPLPEVVQEISPDSVSPDFNMLRLAAPVTLPVTLPVTVPTRLPRNVPNAAPLITRSFDTVTWSDNVDPLSVVTTAVGVFISVAYTFFHL
jgi:hypothetical protein